MKIKKPLLAINFDQKKAKFPYILTPKIDGIRFLMVDGVAVSRTFKPIRNTHIQKLLQEYLPDGVDGEITSGNTFQETTSAVMTIEGEPTFKIWVFDYLDPESDKIAPYYRRIADIQDKLDFHNNTYPFAIEVLYGTHIDNMEELLDFEAFYLHRGFEGVMLRDPNGTYKFGRSTVNNNILLKVKRFVDDEAVLVGIVEKMHNLNPAEEDNFGNTKRSSSMEGLVPAGTMGALIVDKNGSRFSIGTGFDDKTRQEIWDNRVSLLAENPLVKYKFFEVGVKDLPRHPVFIGFRDRDDVS